MTLSFKGKAVIYSSGGGWVTWMGELKRDWMEGEKIEGEKSEGEKSEGEKSEEEKGEGERIGKE